MPAGPATLALRTGATLCTGAVYSGPGRDHRAVVEEPIDTTRTGSLRTDVARITQVIATRLEGLIRRAPEQWHVFQPLWVADRPVADALPELPSAGEPIVEAVA
jgi:KDO2-lipid IV(A) lauroyltransferase